jgi:hypothetical protein
MVIEFLSSYPVHRSLTACCRCHGTPQGRGLLKTHRLDVMVDAVPVLADNPRATVLVLVSLYLLPKKTSGETQQSL